MTAISWPGCTVTIVLRLQKSIFSSSSTSNGLSGSFINFILASLPSMGITPSATITGSFASLRAKRESIYIVLIPTLTLLAFRDFIISSLVGQGFAKKGGSIVTEADILSFARVTRILASFSNAGLRLQTLQVSPSLINLRIALKSYLTIPYSLR